MSRSSQFGISFNFTTECSYRISLMHRSRESTVQNDQQQPIAINVRTRRDGKPEFMFGDHPVYLDKNVILALARRIQFAADIVGALGTSLLDCEHNNIISIWTLKLLLT